MHLSSWRHSWTVLLADAEARTWLLRENTIALIELVRPSRLLRNAVVAIFLS